MALKFEKQTEDKRGKILWITSDKTEIHIVEIKKGYARGGHFHNFDSTHIITSGKVEYKETNLSNNQESSRIVHPISLIRTPANTAHMIIAVEDSNFIEVFNGPYEAFLYPKYRNIVEQKMNSV